MGSGGACDVTGGAMGSSTQDGAVDGAEEAMSLIGRFVEEDEGLADTFVACNAGGAVSFFGVVAREACWAKELN